MKKFCFISLLSAVILSLYSCGISSNSGHVAITDMAEFNSSPLGTMLQNGDISSLKDPIPISLTVSVENTYKKNIELNNASFTVSDKNGKELVTADFTSPIVIPKQSTSDVPVEMDLMFKNYTRLFSIILLGNQDRILSRLFISGSFTAKAGILKKRYSINMMPLSDFIEYAFELSDPDDNP